MPNPASVAAAATISTGAVVCAAVAFEVFVFRPWRQENWPEGVKEGLRREWQDLRAGLWDFSEPARHRQRPQRAPHHGGGNASHPSHIDAQEIFDADHQQHDQEMMRAEMESIEMQQRQQLEMLRAEMAAAGPEQSVRPRQPWSDKVADQDASRSSATLVNAPPLSSSDHWASQPQDSPANLQHHLETNSFADAQVSAESQRAASPSTTDDFTHAPSRRAMSSAPASEVFSLIDSDHDASARSRTVSASLARSEEGSVVNVSTPRSRASQSQAGGSEYDEEGSEWMALDDESMSEGSDDDNIVRHSSSIQTLQPRS